MFKVNNKDTRTMISFSIVNFEHIIAGWVTSTSDWLLILSANVCEKSFNTTIEQTTEPWTDHWGSGSGKPLYCNCTCKSSSTLRNSNIFRNSKFSRRILNYFTKFTFSEFHKKDILPVVTIFVLDLIKASIECSPGKNFMKSKNAEIWGAVPTDSHLFLIPHSFLLPFYPQNIPAIKWFNFLPKWIFESVIVNTRPYMSHLEAKN